MLILYHSNNLKKLTDKLLEQMAKRPGSVLRAQQILVQNPGMKRWLQQKISRQTGIAANIEFPLPSRFIWDLFMSQFEDVESLSAYDAEVMRWQLMAVLQQHADDPALSTIKSYLDQDADTRGVNRFQLAQRLAGLFDQYLVYRPEMIERWEQGKPADSVAETWQSNLWRLLRKRNAQPHRAQLMNRLLVLLREGQPHTSNLPANLYVFAISAMSPMYMKVLQALAQHIDVHFFILNPCQHYWGDIQSRKDQVRLGQPLQVDNELLASLGKQGRDYIDQFYDELVPPQEFHHFVKIKPDSLLKSVQYDILHLGLQRPEQTCQLDNSIQVVSCYSELRELQVLHDRLLAMLAEDETLQPHEIVVMCPDIDTLTPYVEAVFGMQPEHKKIPFSISDNNDLAASPLIQVIGDWMKLATSRFSVNEILGWLELPAIQRAFGLDADALEIIRHWISATHIHWGLDREHKQQLQLGDNNLNTWAHGLGQLITRYLMNDDVKLFAGIPASQTVISASEMHALGQLQKFLDTLVHWSQHLQHSATLPDWQNTINALIDKLMQLDEDEEWLIKPLRDQLADWSTQASQAGFGEKLDATLVAQLLQNSIEAGFSHHHYLTGAVNFCNLIPMRTIPFRVVCLIGMGEDRFPRTEVPARIDLISRWPRKGDRSRREDDRYMFLQSLLSAQQCLYLSYVGKNKKDDTDIEPSVVIRELLDQVLHITGLDIKIQQTALQPFSADNFEQGSYAELWQVLNPQTPVPFNQAVDVDEIDKSVSLGELINFYSNPVRYFFENKLNTNLMEYDEGTDDEETFALDPLGRYLVNKNLLNDLFETGQSIQESYLNSGILAQQNSGKLQYARQLEQAAEYYNQVTGHPGFNGYQEHDITLELDEYRLKGQVISYSVNSLLQFSLSSLKGKSLFPHWIQHCVLNANGVNADATIFFKDQAVTLHALSVQQARQQLTELLDLFNQGNRSILPFYIDSAFEYQKINRQQGKVAATQKLNDLWNGEGFKTLREANDQYLQTSRKNDALWPQQFFQLSEQLMEPVFAAMEQGK